MKKLLFGAAALLLMDSCSGNGTAEKAKDDSASVADSIAKVEAAKAAAEQARLDSLRQDSIEKAEAAAKYDDLVDKFVSSVNKIERAADRHDFSNMHALVNKYTSLQNQVNKIKDNLTEEQLSKVKKAERKYRKLGQGRIAA